MYGHDGCSSPESSGLILADSSNTAIIQKIFQETYRSFLKSHQLNEFELKVLQDILTCRTQVLGGQYSLCPECGHRKNHFNSCGNRNCPTCQWLSGVMWTRKQLENFLPVPHHQVTMTLPAELRGLAMVNKRLIYDLMVRASSQTLIELTLEKYGVIIGVTTLLHTWNRWMKYHPHTHSMASCGGLSLYGNKWVSIGDKYFLPVKQIESVFRRKMLTGIKEAYHEGKLNFPVKSKRVKPGQPFLTMLKRLDQKKWIVHVEAPAGKQQPVVKYLATYIRRITISNSRIKWFRDGRVCFETRKGQTETLAAEEFMRRYLQHLLPKGFHKVRHFGLYSRSSLNSKRLLALDLVPEEEKISYNLKEDALLGEHQGWEDIVTALTGMDPRCCEKCGHHGFQWLSLGRGYCRKIAAARVLPPSYLTVPEVMNSS